jgi:hypothetical protein
LPLPCWAWRLPHWRGRYVSDDPEPTDYKLFEIYTFTNGTAARGDIGGETGIDFNCGAAPDLQLTATLPAAFDRPAASRIDFGLGNIEIAVKCRFLHRDTFGLDVSFFPRVFLPSSRGGANVRAEDARSVARRAQFTRHAPNRYSTRHPAICAGLRRIGGCYAVAAPSRRSARSTGCRRQRRALATLAVSLTLPDNGEMLFIGATAAWRPAAEAVREQQAIAITDLDARHRRDLPTIVAGDFNATPEAVSIRLPYGTADAERTQRALSRCLGRCRRRARIHLDAR